MKNKFLNKNFKAGFTLIEMLIVIAIIAVLASIALVSFKTIKQQSNDKKRIGDLHKVQAYLELYYNQTRRYPTAASWSELQSILVAANVANALPNDPTGNPYMYGYDSTTSGQHYILGATLETHDSILDDPNTIKTTTYNVACGGSIFCAGM